MPPLPRSPRSHLSHQLVQGWLQCRHTLTHHTQCPPPTQTSPPPSPLSTRISPGPSVGPGRAQVPSHSHTPNTVPPPHTSPPAPPLHIDLTCAISWSREGSSAVRAPSRRRSSIRSALAVMVRAGNPPPPPPPPPGVLPLTPPPLLPAEGRAAAAPRGLRGGRVRDISRARANEESLSCVPPGPLLLVSIFHLHCASKARREWVGGPSRG